MLTCVYGRSILVSMLLVLLPVVTPCHRNVNSQPRVFGQKESGTRPSPCGSLGQWGVQHTYVLLNCPKQKTKGWDSGSWKSNQFLARPRTPQKWVLVPGSLFPKNRQATGMSRTLCQGPLKPPDFQGSSQTDHTGVAGPRLTPRHCQVCHDPHCSQEGGILRSSSHA